jgi:hypothetical protein
MRMLSHGKITITRIDYTTCISPVTKFRVYICWGLLTISLHVLVYGIVC